METRLAKAWGCADRSASLVPPPVPADCLHGFFYSNTGKKKKVAFLLKKKQNTKTKKQTQHLPQLFSIAVQEHKEWILVVFAGCTIFCGWVDRFESLTFDPGSLGIPWFCKLGNLELRLLKEVNISGCAFAVNPANVFVGCPDYLSL